MFPFLSHRFSWILSLQCLHLSDSSVTVFLLSPLLGNAMYNELLSKKKSLNVIFSNFTGKNSHWQPMSKNVVSVSDVMIKGDNSLMEMWMIKGYRARVGGMYEDVLVVQSVGPVATKHLISLIKRPLAGSSRNSGTQATCQDCTHLPSLAHRQTRPLARTTQATEEKKVLKEILGKFSRHSDLWSSKNKAANCIWSGAETQSHKCICCAWLLDLLFVLKSLETAFRVPSTEKSEC